ncbi:unnamed protein product [Coccothraustes coccothraustes]
MPSRVLFTPKSLHCPSLPSPRRLPRSFGVTFALGLRCARRPLNAAALSPQLPLTAGPDLPPGRAPGFARHPGPANQRAACGRPRGLAPTRQRLLEAASKRPRGPPAPGRPACQ